MSRWEIRLAIGLIGIFAASVMPLPAQAVAIVHVSEVSASAVLESLPANGEFGR